MLRRSAERRQVTQNIVSSNRGKKVWTEEEDEALRTLVEVHGTGNWTLIAQSLQERSGKQCRERFHNHLDKGIKKGDWTEEEDRIIIILQRAMGNQWAKITKMLPGRTDNAVKNRFHATERAKSRGKLDDTFLNDPAYTEKIIKEALRVNGESGESSVGATDLDTESTVSTYSVQQMYATAGAYAPNNRARNLNAIGIAVPIVAAPSESMDLEDDMYDDDDEEDEEEYSVDELMDLDIISLDEDDFEFEDMNETSTASPSRPQQYDPSSCFGFDWGSGRFNPADIGRAKDLMNKASMYCGLDNCMSTANHAAAAAMGLASKPPVPTTATPSDMYYLQQKMSLNATSGGAGYGYANTTHHHSHPQQVYPTHGYGHNVPYPHAHAHAMSTPYVQSQQQQHHPQPVQQQSSNYMNTFASPTSFFCSR